VKAITISLLAGAMSISRGDAQDFLGPFRRESIDWRRWEGTFGRPTPASLRALGVCKNQVDLGAEHFHFIDADGDGRADLLYSGPAIDCDRVHEAENTTIFLNAEGGLRRVFSGVGRVVSMWREVPWHAVGFVLRSDGCCSDPSYSLYTYLPRRLDDAWTFQLATILAARQETVLPTSTFDSPRPFTVAQDRYNLRFAPVVDDTTVGDIDQFSRGNIQATFSKGSRGIALSEQMDSTGRIWWFVIMHSAKVGQRVVAGSPGPPWEVGWMSSRFLTRDTTAAANHIDTAGVMKR
jgi:hypothetical protein